MPQQIHKEYIPAMIGQFLTENDKLGTNTRDAYRRDFTQFVNWLADQKIQRMGQLETGLLRRYFTWLHEVKGRSDGGVHASYRVIRSWLNWLDDNLELDEWTNPIARIKKPLPKPPPIEGVPIAHIFRMAESCRGHWALRDRAMLLALLDTAARAFEFRALRVRDANLISGLVLIQRGKGGAFRWVMLGRRSRTAVRAYLKTRPVTPPDSPLFLSEDWAEYTYWGLRSWLIERAHAAGFEHTQLHGFRRTCAVEMKRNDVHIADISAYLGHKDIATTMRYLRITPDDIQRAHAQGGPVDHAKVILRRYFSPADEWQS